MLKPIPDFLYGTAWKEERTADLTFQALQAGFRGIDTANQRRHYHEAGVGEALMRARDHGIGREDLFLQTKFTFLAGQDHRLPYDRHAPITQQVQQSLKRSLLHLHTDYLDSFVLHGPMYRHGLHDADWEAWDAMTQLKQSGVVRQIGLSNVSAGQLQELVANADVPPSYVQNRCFAALGWDRDVRALCANHDIKYQGFSLLTANLREIQRPQVIELAERLRLSLPQLVFGYAFSVGMVALTGTSSPQHMREDLLAKPLDATDAETFEIWTTK
ncbi:MAG: aldo/keto reductase [Acidobacteria bacterium]|nr:aldo/keto reductase [Acidobacteriota bacterium]